MLLAPFFKKNLKTLSSSESLVLSKFFWCGFNSSEATSFSGLLKSRWEFLQYIVFVFGNWYKIQSVWLVNRCRPDRLSIGRTPSQFIPFVKCRGTPSQILRTNFVITIKKNRAARAAALWHVQYRPSGNGIQIINDLFGVIGGLDLIVGKVNFAIWSD